MTGPRMGRGWATRICSPSSSADALDARRARGADLAYTFSVEFIEAACGAKKRVVMADGKTLDITIPGGLKDGQTIRLRGQGHPGRGGADPGDAPRARSRQDRTRTSAGRAMTFTRSCP